MTMIFYFQEDGTWTDIPRCIEHDPGVDEQIPGTCPSIPGYCAQGFLNQRCTFDCVTGPVGFKQKNSIEYILIDRNIRYILLNWVHPKGFNRGSELYPDFKDFTFYLHKCIIFFITSQQT